MPKTVGKKAGMPVRGEVLPEPSCGRSRARPTPTSAEEILERVLGPMRGGEGIRHGWLGDSGQGKTYANAWIIDEIRRAGLVDAVMILDDKGPEPQYAGTYRANTADLVARPPDPEAKEPADLVVLRGHTLNNDESEVCSADEVGETAFALAYSDERAKTLVSIDELRRAVSPAGREWASRSVPRLFAEGRGVGVSVTWTTQSPQRIPLEAYDQTETLGIFRCGRRAINYLRTQDMLAPEVLALLPELQRGEFVLFEASGEWDGRVYRAPFRR